MTVDQTTCKRCRTPILNAEMKDDLEKFDRICCKCITVADRQEVMEILCARVLPYNIEQRHGKGNM